MRFGKLSFTASAILFMGVATVLVGSALKLAHMGLGGIPLWNAANALQQIGIIAVSATFLLNVKTLMGTTEAKPVERYVPPRKPAMRFAELPRTDPKPDSARHSHLSPLGDALQKIHERPDSVRTVATLKHHGLGGERLEDSHEPGEREAFTAHEPPQANDPHRTSEQGAHDRGALQTAEEHCFGGSGDRMGG